MDNIIVVKDLVKKFKEVTAVNGISFEVPRGEVFAFLGPNGAGKSTTIKMLTTILDKTSGHITLNGFDPEKNREDVRKSFGIVFQDHSLDDDLTAYENMEFHAALYNVTTANNVRQHRIEEMMKFVELWDRKDSMVKTFSGGMKRRLEIARGLLHHPKILFLDEPTLGLDPQTRNHVWEYLKEINKNENMTIFFTTHYMEEAEKIADKISVIDHGDIIATGTAEDLKKQTSTETLEDAFLALTGKNIRENEATGLDGLRSDSKMWRRH